MAFVFDLQKNTVWLGEGVGKEHIGRNLNGEVGGWVSGREGEGPGISGYFGGGNVAFHKGD